MLQKFTWTPTERGAPSQTVRLCVPLCQVTQDSLCWWSVLPATWSSAHVARMLGTPRSPVETVSLSSCQQSRGKKQKCGIGDYSLVFSETQNMLLGEGVILWWNLEIHYLPATLSEKCLKTGKLLTKTHKSISRGILVIYLEASFRYCWD